MLWCKRADFARVSPGDRADMYLIRCRVAFAISCEKSVISIWRVQPELPGGRPHCAVWAGGARLPGAGGGPAGGHRQGRAALRLLCAIHGRRCPAKRTLWPHPGATRGFTSHEPGLYAEGTPKIPSLKILDACAHCGQMWLGARELIMYTSEQHEP